MCGIIGYVGQGDTKSILLSSLKRLEYRGYDSAGIAIMTDEGVSVFKKKGKVAQLENALKDCDITGSVGIGHTRWATHGTPSDINSHPHTCGRVTLVHNGIIENYAELRKELAEKGYKTISETDSEIAAILLDSLYKNDPIDAINALTERLYGSFALGIIFSDISDTLYAVRRDSPLIAGESEGENFIASDIPAILPYTRKYYICDSDEITVVTKDSIKFIKKGLISKKETVIANADTQSADKNGFPHFMLKEIYESPRAVHDTLLSCNTETGLEIRGKIHIVACGSAMHAGLVGKYAIEKLCRIPVNVEIASEFRYNTPILEKDDLVIAISQSGETADTVAALRLAKEQGIRTLAIVNVPTSTLAREADSVLHTRAGVEICVATTKAYICQVAVLYSLALDLSRSIIGEEKYGEYKKSLGLLPEYLQRALDNDLKCKELAQKIKVCENLFFIGRGQDYCVCTEGSLKLKEVSYIHSEAYPAGELKHGTISLITEGTPVIAVMTDRSRIHKTVSNVKEAHARGADVLCITYHDIDVSDFCDKRIDISSPDELFSPLIAAVPLQLYAYYAATARGNDVDKPRNLAKSVTVE